MLSDHLFLGRCTPSDVDDQSRGHGQVDLSVQQPGGGVAQTDSALKRQRQQASFGLADQTDGQEPGRQRQLGVLHQAAGRQRGLMSTAVALEQALRAVANVIVSAAVAAWAVKPPGQQAAINAAAQCASVPKQRRNSGNDMPGWNWIRF